MGVQDQFTHWIGHEEARITAHRKKLPHFGGGNLQMSDGVNKNAARA